MAIPLFRDTSTEGPHGWSWPSGLFREPAIVALTVIALTAAAVGILQGYATLGRRTIREHGMADFGLFYASATQYLSHGHLYGPLVRPGQRKPSDARNLNPPHASVLFLPFALLPARPALLAWVLLNLLAFADMVRIGVQELRWRPVSLGGLAGAVFLLAWAPAAALVITAQLALLVAWLTTRAWRAARHGNWPRAGWWLGAALSAKIFLLVFVPFLALRREWRALRNVVLMTLALVAIGCVVFRPSAYVEWCRQFGEVTWHGHYMNTSLWGLLARVLDDFEIVEPAAVAPAWILPIWAAGASVVLAATFWRTASSDIEVDRSFTLLIAASLLVSPLGWVYYFWLALMPACATVRHEWGRGHPLGLAVWACVAVGVLWHASGTLWFQPSAVATITCASPYFWAASFAWLWLAMPLQTLSRR